MPRFIAVHTAPITEEMLKGLAEEQRTKGGFPEVPAGVSWKLSYCDFDDNKFFCEWESPNKEEIEKMLKSRDIPTDGVYPVRLFNAAKAELEA